MIITHEKHYKNRELSQSKESRLMFLYFHWWHHADVSLFSVLSNAVSGTKTKKRGRAMRRSYLAERGDFFVEWLKWIRLKWSLSCFFTGSSKRLVIFLQKLHWTIVGEKKGKGKIIKMVKLSSVFDLWVKLMENNRIVINYEGIWP